MICSNFKTRQRGLRKCQIQNGKYAFTNAGYLFFASNPRKRFANAFVRVLKYDICPEQGIVKKALRSIGERLAKIQ